MKTHVIEKGVVVNTIVASVAEAQLVFPDSTLVDAELLGGSIGDLWDGVVLTRPLVDIAALKVAKNLEINEARLAATFSTFSHSGKVFSCDQLSRSDIDGINGYVALNSALPAAWPGAWKATDNSFFPIADVPGWKAFYASMVAAGSINFAHSQTLKAALAVATTPAQIASIIW